MKSIKTEKSGCFPSSRYEDIEYFVTLKSCTCADFKERQLPCKHIYRLALWFGYIKLFHEGKEIPKQRMTEIRQIYRRQNHMPITTKCFGYRVVTIHQFKDGERTFDEGGGTGQDELLKRFGSQALKPPYASSSVVRTDETYKTFTQRNREELEELINEFSKVTGERWWLSSARNDAGTVRVLTNGTDEYELENGYMKSSRAVRELINAAKLARYATNN